MESKPGLLGIGIRIQIKFFWDTLESQLESESLAIGIGIGIMDVAPALIMYRYINTDIVMFIVGAFW